MSIEITGSVPPPGETRGRKPKYPFNDLESGQSFFVPESTASKRSVQAAASAFARRTEVKLTTRESVEDGVQGTRVWRN